MTRVKQVLKVHSNEEINGWLNDDIRPLPPNRRTWDVRAFVSFWAINQIALTNWQLGASLVALGLSVWQVVIATIIGKAIITAVAIGNGYVGGEWHIGYPVYMRVVFGMYGHYLLLVQRIFLSLIWFSVQSWTGGLCVQNILAAIIPSYQNMRHQLGAHMDSKQFVGWILYNLLMIPMCYLRPWRLNKVVLHMNIISFTTLLSIMIWSLSEANGAGPLVTKHSTSDDLGWAIVSGVSSTISSIAVGLTSQMDYARFARNKRDQVVGQYSSIMGFGVILPLFGCLTASATMQIYGETIWNPPNLVQKWLDTDYSAGARAGAFFAGVGLLVCQLAINTIDNAFSTGMDMAGLLPTYITIRRGAYIGLAISCVMCPWELLSSAKTFLSVLSAYSVFLGSMIGVCLCEYWVLRSRRIKLSDLYTASKQGIYYYSCGFNWRSFTSWFIGWSLIFPGFINNVAPNISVPTWCIRLYELAFPYGLCVGFAVHYILNRIWPPVGLGIGDEVDYFGTFTDEECARLGIAPRSLGDPHGCVFEAVEKV